MRKLISIFTILFFATTNLVQAESNLTTISAEKLVRVEIENLAQNASILISDYKGEVLHQETVYAQNYSASYDLNRLPAGEYTISVSEIEDKKITKTNYSVAVENGLTLINAEDVETVFFPTLTQKGNQLFANALSINVATDVIIQFTDSNNKTVHTDSFVTDGFKGRVYSLETLKPGTYTVTCFVNGEITKKSITI